VARRSCLRACLKEDETIETTETMTRYRRLSVEEIILLGQQWENYQRWERVREYVMTLYPPDAHEITISVTSEYTDSSYDDRAHVLVANREGGLLSYDLSRPWWGQFDISDTERAEMLEDNSSDIRNAPAMAAEAIERLVADLLGVELVELIETWQPRDPITYAYVVDTPPAISFAEVLVAE
jgi:hypothetical protein